MTDIAQAIRDYANTWRANPRSSYAIYDEAEALGNYLEDNFVPVEEYTDEIDSLLSDIRYQENQMDRARMALRQWIYEERDFLSYSQKQELNRIVDSL